MTERLVIGGTVVEITFGAHDATGEMELAAFVQERLPALVKEVFDGIAAEGMGCPVERLVIDLGDLPGHRFMEEMPARLREALRRQLLEKAERLTSQAAGEYDIESRRSRLEQFLETGRLPPGAAGDGPSEVDGLLRETLRSVPSAFLAYVRHSPRREVIIGRLARQFSSGALAELIALVEPGPDAGPEVADAGEEALVARRERRLGALFPDDTAAPGAHDPAFASTGEGDVSTPAVREEGERYAVSRLLGRIDFAFRFGEPRGIYHDWTRICLAHPALVRAVFMRRMGVESSRRRLAEGFPESMLLDLSTLMAPGHDPLLVALVEQPELRATGEARPPDDELRNAFWFHTLTYLHHAGPDRFSAEEYLRGLIPHLKRSGLDRARLGSLLRRALAEVTPPEGDLPAPSAPPDAIYHRLLRRLTGEAREPAMAKEIAWLGDTHPELLRRLFDQLQSREVTLDTGLIDAAEAEALVAFFVSPGHRRGSFGFRAEIERHAGQARDRRCYYLHVLECLARHRVVDLEAAMALSPEEAEAAAGRVVPEEPLATDRTPATGAASPHDLYTEVEQRLKGVEGVASIGSLLEELTRRDPAFIARLYAQWRTGAFATALPRLTLDELRPLVLGFAELTPEGAVPGFRRRVEAYAATVDDQQAYYRFLLGHFITGKAIHLERAAAAEGTVPALRAESDPDRLPDVAWSEETVIANAGMVITAPFLPRLFATLELTSAQGFRDGTAAQRAVHLLQYMVNGRSESPEFLLPLNKLLCGVPLSLPLVRSIEIQRAEQEAISGMLQALMAHGKIIGNTSIQRLRKAVLQREGRLRFGGDRWLLQTEKRGMDELLDQIPWGVSAIKYPWMPWALQVEWL